MTTRHQKPEARLLRKLTATAAVALSATAIGACAEDEQTPVDDTVVVIDRNDSALLPFESCDSLDQYVADYVTELAVRSYESGYYGGGIAVDRGVPEVGFDNDGAEAPTAGGDDSSGGGGSAGPDDFSETNVQEVGVDEADLVKTNGEELFVIENNYSSNARLHIMDSWPAESAHELAIVELEGYGEQMFLLGDTVVTLTHIYQYAYNDYEPGGRETNDSLPPEEGGTGDEGGSSDGSDGGDPDVIDPEPGEPGEEPIDPDVPVYTENFQGLRLTFIDVSDPANPEITNAFDIEGSLASARAVDGTVYLAINSEVWQMLSLFEQAFYAAGIDEPDWSATGEAREAEVARLRAELPPVIRGFLADGGREAFIPDLRTEDGRSDLFACGDFMRPSQAGQLGVLSILAVDPSGDAAPTGTALLASGWQLYGSTTSLYVAQDSRWWFWGYGEDPVTRTHIHQFELNGGDPVYAASGAVEGWILNQFSMSEYDGHLRVATTDQTWGGSWWGVPVAADVAVSDGGDVAEPTSGEGSVSGGSTGSADAGAADEEEPSEVGTDDDVVEPEPGDGDDVVEPEPVPEPEERGPDANNVFVLARNGANLDVVGEVRGLAPGEQIFAVRFLGDRGFVVTFRQTDPLYSIDLSDPTNPTVTGELHIPGFSNYLHPLGDNHLIGIGQDADLDGRIIGLHLQIFDVSDMENPVRVAQEVIDSGWSNSEAQYDHHAFTYYPSRAVLAIPATLEEYDSETYSYFSGLILYRVDVEDGFTEIGRVSHTGLAEDYYCDTMGWECGSDAERGYPWYAWMRRAVFVDDFVYAISNLGVTSSAIEAPGEILSDIGFGTLR
jgi:hypothetical protein